MPVFNTTPLPTEVYVAPTGTGVYASCTITNISPSQTLFIGLSAVTPNTGMPLVPNGQIKLASAPKSLYASSNWAAGAALATASASAATAGTSSWTVASGGMANIPVGTYFLIGSGTGQEALCVATSASTTTITTTTASLFDHAASEVLDAVTTTPGSIRVERSTTLPPVALAAQPTR